MTLSVLQYDGFARRIDKLIGVLGDIRDRLPEQTADPEPEYERVFITAPDGRLELWLDQHGEQHYRAVGWEPGRLGWRAVYVRRDGR